MSRVQTLFRRMLQCPNDPTTIRTCCGALAIISRNDEYKMEITTDCLPFIIQAMATHRGNKELCETACDLLWSLAFNNHEIKMIIGEKGGIKAILDGLTMHVTAPDLTRSALGTLSNLCQAFKNQNIIGDQGGINLILSIIKVHKNDSVILPFALDTMASIITNHKINTVMACKSGGINRILAVLDENSLKSDILKSGCHLLALISDVEGHGKLVADNNGIHVVVKCMHSQKNLNDLQKISTVILLRILNEANVAGVMLQENVGQMMFEVMEQQLKSAETCTAACHILYEILQSAIENDIDIQPFFSNGACRGDVLIQAAKLNSTVLSLVRTVFRVFALCSQNIVCLPLILNMENIESLLSITLMQSRVNDITDSIVKILCSTKRSSIESHTLRNPEVTLPALLVCLRAQPEEIELVTNIFAITSRWWRVQKIIHKNIASRVIFGFVAASIRFLGKLSKKYLSCANELMEVCNFVREVVFSSEGIEAVVTCGGRTVLESLRKSLFTVPESAELIGVLDIILQHLDPQRNVENESDRTGDTEYAVFLAKIIAKDKNQSDLEVKSEIIEKNTSANNCQSIHDKGSIQLHNDDDPQDQSDSSSIDCDEELNNENEEPHLVDSNLDSLISSKSVAAEKENQIEELQDVNTGNLQNALLPTDNSSKLKLKKTADKNLLESKYSDLIEHPHYLIDANNKRFPRHPCKNLYRNQNNSTEHEASRQLLTVSPDKYERCFVPSALMDDYIQESISRQEAFLRKPACNRIARCVYFCKFAGDEKHRRPTSIKDSYFYEIPDVNHSILSALNISNGVDSGLTFDAEFESGNLLCAIQIGLYEYDLILRPDLYTTGYTQWFYFAISNITNVNTAYRFNIINLSKPDSLFNHGLRPVRYSSYLAEAKNIGWRRVGENICYYENCFPRKPTNDSKLKKKKDTELKYYTLSFTIKFPEMEDTVLLAHSYPYTLTDHKIHINRILKTSSIQKANIIRRQILCISLAGFECDVLTITDFNTPSSDLDKRKCVVFTSRVHPGETQASWMMRGIIDFLTSDDKNAKLLRHFFVFKIVPILNPDGVFYGNNRCGLSACDLNRQWKFPSKSEHPTVFHSKSMIRMEKAAREVSLYVDIHGHSRKQNIFMYGCDTKKHSNPKARVFPKMFSMNSIGKKYVSFDDCSFHVNKGRESTARVVVARECSIGNSFTLESSFCGANFGILKNMHFNISHLLDVGNAICDTLLEYTIPDINIRKKLMDDNSVSRIIDCTLDINGYIIDQMKAKHINESGSQAITPCPAQPTSKKKKKIKKAHSFGPEKSSVDGQSIEIKQFINQKLKAQSKSSSSKKNRAKYRTGTALTSKRSAVQLLNDSFNYSEEYPLNNNLKGNSSLNDRLGRNSTHTIRAYSETFSDSLSYPKPKLRAATANPIPRYLKNFSKKSTSSLLAEKLSFPTVSKQQHNNSKY